MHITSIAASSVHAPFSFSSRSTKESNLSRWKSLIQEKSIGNSEAGSSFSAGYQNVGGVFFGCTAESQKHAGSFVQELVEEDILKPNKLQTCSFSEFMLNVSNICVHWSREREINASMKDPNTGSIDYDRGDNDPIFAAMEEISKDSWLLHLQDWNVASVVEAMMIRRVFECYFHFGGFVVLDSRVPLLKYDSGIDKFNSNYVPTQEMLKTRIIDIQE